LRLFDDVGNELPYFIDRPAPASKVVQTAKTFQVTLNANSTVIRLETGLTQPIDGVTLETPAASFIKSVRLEGSADGQRWQVLAQGLPIFRQAGGASRLRLDLTANAWRELRLTVDDQRSQPIPFTGARVHAASATPTPSETQAATIKERHENPGESRLTLDLGAANLNVSSIQIETAEPLFTRTVTLAVPQISEDAIREQTVAKGILYRVALEGQATSANLSVPLENQVQSRELLLLIMNQDSPPLPITAVRVERRPVYLTFLARSPGVHHLLTGNPRCSAPRYDLAALGANLRSASLSAITLPPLALNPNFRPAEVLAGVQSDGTSLDISHWVFRKPIKFTRGGAQQLELDLEILSHAQGGFQDLRLMRGSNQAPYILERTSITRALTPGVTSTNDAKDRRISRWIIKLPQPNLPITRLSCAARTALFQRDVTLYEEVTDNRGDKYRRHLSNVSWVQTPERKSKEFALALSSPLQTDTLVLETNNGDNPALELENFQAFHSVTRLLFKARPEDAMYLYYGNAQAASPHYDLRLVAGELLSADKAAAALGAEERLKKLSWSESQTPGKGGVLFWGVLALVVVVLLVVVARLLPKAPSAT